jgi:PAS domain S-box-containing protein
MQLIATYAAGTPLAERRWMIALRRFSFDLILGALGMLAALLLKLLWPSVFGADPDALFIIPAAVCAWRRGFRCGATALLCGAFAVGDLFLTDGFSPSDLRALSVFLIEGGAIVSLVAFSRRRLDASERIAGQVLRESEEKYRLIVTNMPDVAWATDASGTTLYIGENVEAVTGYTRAQLSERHFELWFGCIHPDDAPLVRQAFELLFSDGNLFDIEYRYQHRNGDWIWIHDRACTTYNVNGVPYAFGLFGDVTARRKEQDELKRCQRLLAEAERVANVGSWSREIPSNAVTWSEETYRILGATANQFDGTLEGMLRWVHPDDLEAATASARAVENGDTIDTQVRFIRADGEQRTVRTRAELVRNQLGQPMRVVGTLKDVTERIEAEERERKLRIQLEDAQRLSELGRVAANIAHEVNNVLMAINPQAELVDRAAPGNSNVHAAATRIRSAVSRGRRITEEILRFTHPREPEILEIDARQWLKDVIDEVRTLVPQRISVVLDLPREPVFIQGDSTQLQQVILNLCSNAQNAMPEGGVMTIGLESTDSPFVDVTIADTGIGIAKGILPRIFEPLFSGTPSRGSGLGLAVARQIVTLHGGSINAVSQPGQGSKFTVRLPRPAPQPEAEQSLTDVQPPDGACRRLLLVEDDDAVSCGIAALLEIEGIEVQIAREGGLVAQAIRDFEPDAMVLDVTLPDISGTIVFENVRREWPRLPIVISTGQMCDPSIFALERQPHTEFLMKPYASAELMERIGRIVAG